MVGWMMDGYVGGWIRGETGNGQGSKIIWKR